MNMGWASVEHIRWYELERVRSLVWITFSRIFSVYIVIMLKMISKSLYTRMDYS